jgi:hypothetical protein
MNLRDRIYERIRKMPARVGGYISVAPDTLGSLMDDDLLRRVATEAADEAGRPDTSTDGRE